MKEYLLTHGKGDATRIAEDLGLDRGNVSRALNRSERFTRVGKDGNKVLYGVKTAADKEGV